jgi:outer membrane cobalamin receptor
VTPSLRWRAFRSLVPGLLGLVLLPVAAPEVRAQLRPLPLDTLAVIGSRTSAELPLRTRGVQVLDRAALDGLPARSVAEALRWALGVEILARSSAQADVAIRGGTFEQVLILVDGVRMSDPQTGHFDLDLAVPLDRVERIEILRGPASAQYGSDAVGGVVNVVTRGAAPGFGVRAEGGSFGTGLLAMDAGFSGPGGVAGVISAEGGRSDGHREGTDWDTRIASLRLDAPAAGGLVRLDMGRARRAFGAADFYAPFPSYERTDTETVALAWVPGPAATLRVEPRLTWRGHDDDFTLIRENPSVYRNIHRSTQLGAEVTVRFAPTPRSVLALGTDAARHALTSNALGERSESRGAAFAEVAVLAPAGVELALGVRHDRHEVWGGFTSPSVAMALGVAEDVRLRGSWNRSFRGPSWTERYYADPGHVPNPELGPEQGHAWEAGVHWGAREGLELSGAIFHRTAEDLIDWARTPAEAGGTPGPWVPRNVNEARFRGAEAEARWTLTEGTRLGVAATLLSVRAGDEPGLESKYALRPRTEEVTGSLRQVVPGGVSVSALVTHARQGGPGATYRSATREVDLRLEAPVPGGPLHGARIYLDLRNLTDADHPDLTGQPVPGRAVYLGLQARFGGRAGD